MVKDLKSKFPSKKKKGGEDESSSGEPSNNTEPKRAVEKTQITQIGNLDDDDDAPESILDKIKAKFSKKNSSSDDDADDDDEAPKKKRNPIIMIIIVAGIILMIFEEDIFPPENPPVAESKVAEKPLVEEKKTAAEPSAVEVPADATKTPPTTDSGDVVVPPEDGATTPTDAKVDTVVTPPVEEPAATTTSPDETSTTPTLSPDVPVVDPNATTPSETTVVPEEKIDFGSDTTPTEIADSAPVLTTPSEDSIDGKAPAPTSTEDNLTTKILEDLENQAKESTPKEPKREYVSPPDYEYKGRGLVYNCAGKHWACVDAPSFKICEDNNSSTKFLRKKTECHPFNVYQNQEGCEAMQNRVVSSNAKTDFCLEN